MVLLIWRSLRYRAASFFATFLALFLGAMVVMAFASMLDTAAGSGVDADSRATLHNMAGIVGGWGALIVAFAVVSTLTLAVRQRATEVALLKAVGATPGQLTRMIVGEATAVALIAGLAAIAPATLVGRLLLELLKNTDQVAPRVGYAFGPIAIVMGPAITLGASTIAALVTARRTVRLRTTDALADAALECGRMSRKRVIAGWVSLAVALDLAVITTAVMPADDAQATAGQASIFAAIGFALLGPKLVRVVADRLAGAVESRGGGSGYLAALNIRQRNHQLASMATPVILFVGIAVGTLSMQDIDNAATAAAGTATTNQQRNIEMLNYVVVGIIAAFAAVMLLNTTLATIIARRREFGQQRLAGATRPQTLAMVALEAAVVVACGVLFGALAAIFTIVPYNAARTSSVIPDASFAIFAGVVATAASLTLAGSLAAARRALAIPPLQAAGARQ